MAVEWITYGTTEVLSPTAQTLDYESIAVRGFSSQEQVILAFFSDDNILNRPISISSHQEPRDLTPELVTAAYSNIVTGQITLVHCEALLQNLTDPSRSVDPTSFLDEDEVRNPDYSITIPLVGSKQDVIAMAAGITTDMVTIDHVSRFINRFPNVMKFYSNKSDLKARISSRMSSELYTDIYEPLIDQMAIDLYGEAAVWMQNIMKILENAYSWASHHPNAREYIKQLSRKYNLITHFGLEESYDYSNKRTQLTYTEFLLRQENDVNTQVLVPTNKEKQRLKLLTELRRKLRGLIT